MSRRTTTLVALGALIVLVAVLYLIVVRPRQQALEVARREASRLSQEVAGLRNRVADLESLLDDLRQTSAELAEVVDQRAEQVDALRAARDELASELEQEISVGEVRVEKLRDSLRVDLVDQVLFDSGEADLKPDGAAVLRKVGNVLKKSVDRKIIVQGHTDNVPIRGRLAERFPTNWELSAARAVNVVRFLHEELGVEPERLSALALSEYQPRTDNSTDEGRLENRRIEIVLAPPILAPLTGAASDAVADPSASDREPDAPSPVAADASTP
jgi:chemotaxis protein MotB